MIGSQSILATYDDDEARADQVDGASASCPTLPNDVAAQRAQALCSRSPEVSTASDAKIPLIQPRSGG